MKFFILAVGNKMPDWIKVGYLEYIKRLPREISVHLLEIKPEKRISGKQTEQLLSAESQRIRAVLPLHCRIIVLDEHGEQYPTIKFADEIKRWTIEGNDLVFIIGGADGLHAEIKRMASDRIALSKMTLPHGLVRVLLAEQLYRAVSILNGHPYHRA
ncbi:23S rRNA (pseudouridine(1915)-N(3))-methyltransferase RlmH [Nitrosomonas sp. JL21]|uniref:23S rRNA (pseudouridine(1915)-N(3))-methyltransferase RlmH n=1 Tax=Nitrosomonas sp. JL21 TaxID=153949 RepID=UPI001368FFBE|nr:23S rRNA (pseudouridine(1915)-N(3))-methyltransferase RlmH [Nitrosomonas sp. JL21]MBL8496291.1 23S rRNA (pseudouridine(1915)-N(3))-methyltransferase RlmH [Nitrosomonas sp.]MCC7090994.1 23S rRNA (pseudouridine(1915)-N(3))-methyltransferase RlmH [Nitrosomonas sp.]MXS76942.1 23S rRNA (pseudouridine(1915)-N(3))-methyltransferase RlmH [Nitrosomonas sp. JL21]